MLVTMKEMLADAKAKHYAIPAFDVSNYEMMRAVLEVCEEEISVFQDENGYSIKSNSRGQNVCQLTKEDLVSSIIEMCPKKINLFCKSDDNTAGFLSRLFEERVNVCYSKSVETIKDFSAITQN